MLNGYVRDVLSEFIPAVECIFKDQLKMLCVYGSACESDFMPYYDCIQFECLLKTPLSGDVFGALFELKQRFQSQKSNRLSGVFISEREAEEPMASTGVFWGLAQLEVVNERRNTAFQSACYLSQGLVVAGRDCRMLFDMPTPEMLLEEIGNSIVFYRKPRAIPTADIHEMEALFQIAQAACWLITGKVETRLAAARWCAAFEGFGSFSAALRKALEIRRYPYFANFPENRNWLYNLPVVAREACVLLESLYTQSVFFEKAVEDQILEMRNDTC